MTAARVLQRGDSLIEAFGPRSTALKDRDERTSLAGRTIVGQPFPVPRPASRGTPEIVGSNCGSRCFAEPRRLNQQLGAQTPGLLRAAAPEQRGSLGGTSQTPAFGREAAAHKIAAARKLPVLFRCPLSRGDYDAPQEPSLTTLKLRRLEMTGGAPARKGTRSGTWATHERMRQAEKRLADQAQASHGRTVRDWQAAGSKKKTSARVAAERA